MLYLASQSPRRRQLLQQLGLEFTTLDIDVAEVHCMDEPALDYVSRVAREKAGAGLLQVVSLPDAVVIGADTEVVLDEETLGKPENAAAAASMLRRLSGRAHHVVSAVWCLSAGREEHVVSVSEVEFERLSDAEIAAYIRSGEPFGKAGGYAIQGRAAAFIRHLSGSYSGVMGLPLFETTVLLRHFSLPTA